MLLFSSLFFYNDEQLTENDNCDYYQHSYSCSSGDPLDEMPEDDAIGGDDDPIDDTPTRPSGLESPKADPDDGGE